MRNQIKKSLRDPLTFITAMHRHYVETRAEVEELARHCSPARHAALWDPPAVDDLIERIELNHEQLFGDDRRPKEYSFDLLATEQAKAEEFIEKHAAPGGSPIGGQFSFVFTITSIGSIVKIRDAVSGDELDLTDYDQL